MTGKSAAGQASSCHTYSCHAPALRRQTMAAHAAVGFFGIRLSDFELQISPSLLQKRLNPGCDVRPPAQLV
jgi:hypothetical protein